MSFTNEYISAEDALEFGLSEIDEKNGHRSSSRQWTIDRERDCHLRLISRGREQETRHQMVWALRWKGSLLTLRLDLMDAGGRPGGPGYSHWRLVRLDGGIGHVSSWEGHRQDVLDVLKQALLAYKDGGVQASCTEYAIELEVAEGCVV